MKLRLSQLRRIIKEELNQIQEMEYKDIRVGQKLLLRGKLHGAYEAVVVQVDDRRITPGESPSRGVVGDPVQVKAVLYPGDEPTLLWVNPDRLMDSDR